MFTVEQYCLKVMRRPYSAAPVGAAMALIWVLHAGYNNVFKREEGFCGVTRVAVVFLGRDYYLIEEGSNRTCWLRQGDCKKDYILLAFSAPWRLTKHFLDYFHTLCDY